MICSGLLGQILLTGLLSNIFYNVFFTPPLGVIDSVLVGRAEGMGGPMRRPHLSILIGDCVCSHGQLHTGQARPARLQRNLAWEENLVVVILYWLMRELSEIFHVYDMMNAGPGLGLRVEMLREINNKLLWYCSNPLISRVSGEQESWVPVVDLQLNELKKKLNNGKIKSFMRLLWRVECWRMFVAWHPLLYCVIFIYICPSRKKTYWEAFAWKVSNYRISRPIF